MKIGDLVSYGKARLMIVLGHRAYNEQPRGAMFRCYCPINQQTFWFYEDDLEVL